MDEIDFAFCARWGARTTLTQTPHVRYRSCLRCRSDFYVNPRPCNAVILTNEKGEILLTRRAFDPAKGTWDLPGGFMDTGETAEESVKRECKEELGIEVENITYLCSGPDRYLFKGVNYHTLGFVFVATIKQGQYIKPLDDVAEVAYFAYTQIPWNELAFPILAETIHFYMKINGHAR
jgi:mutator protein MutT